MAEVALSQALSYARDLKSAYESARAREKELGQANERLRNGYQQSLQYALELKRTYGRLQRAIFQSLLGLANALEAKDAYTKGHSERVGASPALVIYYFGTKDSLLTEALRWSERSFYAGVEEMLRTTPKLRTRLENLVDRCLPEVNEEPDDWGLWFDLWAVAFRHPEVKKDRAALDQQWRDLVTRVVQAGVDGGEIDDVDVQEFTIMWSALIDGLVVQVALEDPLVDVAYAKRVAVDVALKELGLR